MLTKIASVLPTDQKTITVGYDSSNPDNQLISNLISTQLAAAGITAKVQSYPTSEIYGWIGGDGIRSTVRQPRGNTAPRCARSPR